MTELSDNSEYFKFSEYSDNLDLSLIFQNCQTIQTIQNILKIRRPAHDRGPPSEYLFIPLHNYFLRFFAENLLTNIPK